jgi:hypothetical protein
MTFNKKDAAAGALFALIGIGFGASSLLHLRMGTLTRMGPGYFPLVIAGVLIGLGLLIAGKSIGQSPSALGSVPWRGLVLVLAAPLVFGLTVEGLGLVGSTVLTVVFSSAADPHASPLNILGVSVLLTALCVGIFYYGLGMPVTLFGTWIGT